MNQAAQIEDKDKSISKDEARQHAQFLLNSLQSHIGEQTPIEWLAEAEPFTKLKVDVLSIEAMVILAYHTLQRELHGH